MPGWEPQFPLKSSLVVGFRWKPPVLPALPGPRTASRLIAFTIHPHHPAQGSRIGQPHLSYQAALPGWVMRWLGAASPGHLFASTLAYVYMRTALAVLTISAQPSGPGLTSLPLLELSSDIFLSLVFKSRPSCGILQSVPLQPQYGSGLEPTAHWVVDAQGHPLQS